MILLIDLIKPAIIAEIKPDDEKWIKNQPQGRQLPNNQIMSSAKVWSTFLTFFDHITKKKLRKKNKKEDTTYHQAPQKKK